MATTKAAKKAARPSAPKKAPAARPAPKTASAAKSSSRKEPAAKPAPGPKPAAAGAKSAAKPESKPSAKATPKAKAKPAPKGAAKRPSAAATSPKAKPSAAKVKPEKPAPSATAKSKPPSGSEAADRPSRAAKAASKRFVSEPRPDSAAPLIVAAAAPAGAPRPPAAPAPRRKPATPPKRAKAPVRDIEYVTLENGVRVVTERIPGAAETAVGIYVKAGSRYEELNESGVTYLLQRIALHGTKRYSRAQILKTIDSLGGRVELETERDYCSYTAVVAPADLVPALDLLTDLALHPTITKAGFAEETKAVLEELRNDEAEPDFVLDRMFYRSFWKGHGLCRHPHGRLLHSKGQSKLENFKPKTIERYHVRSHHAKGLTVIASGDIDHAAFRAEVERRFGRLDEPKKKVSSPSPTAFRFLALRNRPQFADIRFRIGVPACSAADSERHAARLLNAILGGWAGSRIQRLLHSGELPAREASSELRMYADAGCLSLRVVADREHAPAVMARVMSEIRKLAYGEIPEDELDAAKAWCRAELIGAVATPRGRLDDLARQDRYFKRVVSLEEEVAALEAVKAERVRLLATAWIAPHHLSLVVLGDRAVDIDPKLMTW